MKARQASPIPRTLLCLKGKLIATYDAVAFLDNRAQDPGGRTGAQTTRWREERRLGTAVAIAVILTAISLIALLPLKLLYP